MKKELVHNWMSKDVITATLDTSLTKAHKIMMAEEIRRLPIVDRNGRLKGIVTLGDIRGAEPSAATSLSIWELNYLLAELTLQKIMTPNPLTISATETIGQAARMMLENRVSGLPVVDNYGILIGIITESDIFSMVVVHEWNRETENLVAV